MPGITELVAVNGGVLAAVFTSPVVEA